MYSESDFWYLCLVVGYSWYRVDVVCVSNNKVDVVIVVGVVCVGDSVIGLCVYACGEVEAYWDVDELLEVEMF
jgi:hypothetical protein